MLALTGALAAVALIEPRGDVSGWGIALLVVLGLVTLIRLDARGMYVNRRLRLGALDLTSELLAAPATGTLTAIVLGELIAPSPATTTALLVGGALSVLALLLERALLWHGQRAARGAGRGCQRTLIVGAGWVGAEIEHRLLEDPTIGLDPVGFLDADPAPSFLEMDTRGAVLGAPCELAAVVRRERIDHVVIAFSAAPDSTVTGHVREAQALGLEVSVVPRLFETVSERQWVTHVHGMSLCILATTHPRAVPFLVKDAIERSVAAAALLLLLPLFGAVAIAVKASSGGPVFFRQRRVGRDGQSFGMFKFRTMRVAGTSWQEGMRLPAGSAPGGVEGGDRRTTVGKLLRRTSLDELPQLLNVVLGHMALVGPRPERPEFVDRFAGEVRGYDDRHRVKSGMTGWAQIHGMRGQTSLARRVELDNWYVQNWSPGLDLKILLLTPLEVLRSRSEATTGAAEASPPIPEEAASWAGSVIR